MDGPGFLSFLNDHGFEDTSSTRKMAAVNDAQWDLASRDAWPFLEKQIDLTFTGSSNVASNAPADLRTVLQVVNTVTGAVVVPSRVDDFTRNYVRSATDVSDPTTFYFVGSTMKFYPVPPAGTVLRMIYLFVPATVTETSLESDFAVPPRHHRVIGDLALAALYFEEDDPENAAIAQQRAENRILNMKPDVEQRQLQDPDYIHIVDWDDYD